ncbi:bifunctional cobalt-precorrin-7 (C(5))-methyltransferase/cobalt-precorrin-6B (C(15))-methyltransferase [Rhodospirillum rubrum]|uniref:Precorrin-6Y C5,15-methyltransferase (Decarboxylating) n=2 Tax=Rhodospirillum rubrum TaxID=1085 RepID=Q2RQ08_RHORT|nr:bifunctional cobalt-precorrin-7 (C(5))-methyltransferase/cobalt-precorrin-6B (C(15))-methyltransferase [Rhodospirillum rubrum]AAN75029.1 CobL [Rhodospirillum rubrum ATCC 11170]ABC23787.1 precorrin-6Y C5,15-methyltransferase (decarboxylating) [Rhodospirillum rubrum ATCC 11170]AEO49527.1 precorrin-6Y C5,15-methyltransferase (decarboxylating) [Rhodospirillum rubrum F11]MBK5955465.1 bifunctional cobalt-precorrin-7 (C(5))-methyltransferase/cobalt-precorrin-6B (C(15))-methyltransferase [Rhodospiri
MTAWLTVVGIGEDGLAGLGEGARDAIAKASLLLGGQRHLDLVPVVAGQERQAWPSPFSLAYDLVLARRGTPVCVLASGDPMHYGIGASLAARLEPGEMRVLPAPSSFSLAAARLCWPLQDCQLLTVHGRPLESVRVALYPEARLLILSEDGQTPAALAALLVERGFGESPFIVLEHLGGPTERIRHATARGWLAAESAPCADLNLVAVDCRAEAGAQSWPRLAGLPDSAYRHDGQLTKRAVRAVTLAHLAPLPGQVLWDVGAGCGSIGIEWMRSAPSCRAFAIEADAERADVIAHNRAALGVPGLELVEGRAPAVLEGLPDPDAIFIGGGLTANGVFERCWIALKPGGRLVANAVTLESEARLAHWHGVLGGELTRLSVAHADPVGRFHGWRSAMPVTLYEVVKPKQG